MSKYENVEANQPEASLHPQEFVISKIDPTPGANSAEALALLHELGEPHIVQLSDALLSGQQVTHSAIVVPLLHTAANWHRGEGRHANAIDKFRTILRHVPSDFNVRAVLAEYAAESNDFEEFYALLLPVIPALLQHENLFRDALARFCRVAFERGDITSASAIFSVIGAQDSLLTGGDETAIAIRERLADLARIGVLDLVGNQNKSAATPLGSLLLSSLLALDEHDLLTRVNRTNRALAPGDTVDVTTVRLGWAAADISFVHRWGRPFQAATRLVAALLAACDNLQEAIRVLRSVGVSDDQLHALLTAARAQAGTTLSKRNELAAMRPAWNTLPGDGCDHYETSNVAEQFSANPSIETAGAVWAAAYEAADFRRLIRHIPSGRCDNPLSPNGFDPYFERWNAASRIESPGSFQDDGPAIWYFITWHTDVEQLFRLFSTLSRETNTYVISIGGSDPLSKFSNVSALMLAGNVHFLHRPTVSWGGQKLLFHNVFEVLEHFRAHSAEDALFQIICNRTYPLTGPVRFAKLMGMPGHREVYARRRYSIPPPAWHSEWTEAMVGDLPALYNQALDDIFTKADARQFTELATFKMIYDGSDFRLDMSGFNFSPRPATFEDEFKGGGQQYMISGHSADMRWMSFGRLTSFIDLMTETGQTFSRRCHPRVMRWVHSVLAKHNLRTGDPFILMSRRFVDKILTDPACEELFAASDLGFAPEMNFFDTVAYTPGYDLMHEVVHQYFRTSTNVASGVDIQAASFASDVQKLLFMRKMAPEVSAPFIRDFAERIVEEKGCAYSYVAARTTSPDGISCLPPTLFDLLPNNLAGLRFRLRDLRDRVHFEGRFGANGTVIHDGGVPAEGTWSVTATRLTLTFGWGQKHYEQIATDGAKLILPPSEIVSVRNAWSLFIEIDLQDMFVRREGVVVVQGTFDLTATAHWVASRSREAALLAGFEKSDPVDYPALFSRPNVSTIDFRATPGRQLMLSAVDGFPMLARLDSVSFADGRIIWTWLRASGECLEVWDKAESCPISVSLTVDDLPGDYKIYALSGVQDVTLLAGGRVVSAAGLELGWWHVDVGSVWVFGIPGLSVARATQFQRMDEGWILSGWAWQTLAKTASFRAICKRSSVL